jgi:hypothetical protein
MVAIFEEDGFAAIPALRHMVRQSRRNNACVSAHAKEPYHGPNHGPISICI